MHVLEGLRYYMGGFMSRRYPKPDQGNSGDPMTQLLTREQVTEMFQVSKYTISRWIKHAGLPVIITKGGYRFDMRDIEKYIRDRKFNDPGRR